MKQNLSESYRFYLLTNYNQGDLLTEGELLQEDFKNFITGLLGLVATTGAMGQTAIDSAEAVIKKQQPITVAGKTYDTPQEFASLERGLNTVKQFLGDADLQKYLVQLKNGKNILSGAPPEVIDFYKGEASNPELRGIFQLASSMSHGQQYSTQAYKQVTLTGVNLEQVKATSGVDIMKYLQAGYNITGREYKVIVDTLRNFAPQTDTMVQEFKLDTKQLFREDGYQLNPSDVNGQSQIKVILDSLIKLSQNNVLVEIEIVGSASQIPSTEFKNSGGNQGLAQARACTIAGVLKQGGIDESYLSTTDTVQGPQWDASLKGQERANAYHQFQYIQINAYYIQKGDESLEPAPAQGSTEYTLSKATVTKDLDLKGKSGHGTVKTKGKKVGHKGKMNCPRF